MANEMRRHVRILKLQPNGVGVLKTVDLPLRSICEQCSISYNCSHYEIAKMLGAYIIGKCAIKETLKK